MNNVSGVSLPANQASKEVLNRAEVLNAVSLFKESIYSDLS